MDVYDRIEEAVSAFVRSWIASQWNEIVFTIEWTTSMLGPEWWRIVLSEARCGQVY